MVLQDAGGFGVGGVELGDLHLLGEAELFQQPDAVVVDVDLVPGEAVAGADGVGVVVVVPAFAAGEQGDPPGVAGVVLGLKAARAEHVGGGVDQPGGVQADALTRRKVPQRIMARAPRMRCPVGASAAPRAICRRPVTVSGSQWYLLSQTWTLVAGEVGGVAAQQGGLRVERAAGEDPAGVGPPGAVVRGVRVAVVVGVLMVDAVGGDPEDGSAFERHGAAGGDEVLQPLGGPVSAVGEQAVVAHADADVDGEEVHDAEDGQVLPGEAEERGDGADVEEAHDDGGDPVDAAMLMLAAHAQILLDLLRDFGGEAACGLDDLGSDGRGDGDGAGGAGGFGRFGSKEGGGH